jgi:HD-like signal output (HDOD) protein
MQMGVSVVTQSSVREQTLKCLDRLPKLSPMMTQLLAQLSRRDCEILDLAQTVERDPLLSGQILRLANSAIFGRLRPVASVRHAIAMVGIGAMRKFVLASSIANLFSRTKVAANFSIRRFNVHSVATATLVELLSEEVPFESGEDAFLAGLLHDIGKLLIAVSLPQRYEEILALLAVTGGTLIEAERQVIGIDHAELSGLAVSRWGLSEGIQWAACYHHEPEKAAAMESPGPQKAGLSLGVHHADAYINHLGMSVLPVLLTAGKPLALEIPGFAFPQERVLERFGQEIQRLSDMFH